MMTQKQVKFGGLKVGDLFRYNKGAEAIDKKIPPITVSNGVVCTAIGVDDTIRYRVDDDRIVWVDVEAEDDIALVLAADPPTEPA